MVVLGYPMLHTKFQGHWSIGSGEEDLLKVFTIYGHGGHFGHVTLKVFEHSFIPSAPGGFTRNLVTFGPVAFEEMFETVII